MEAQKYFDKMKRYQRIIISYLDGGEDEDSENSLEKIKDISLNIIISLISSICKNHHRCPLFFDKIYKILRYFIDEIKQTYSSYDLVEIFEESMPIILFLIEQKIINPKDDLFQSAVFTRCFRKELALFFYPELKFITTGYFAGVYEHSKLLKDPHILDSFKEKRLKGENETSICYLIREDLIDDFFLFVNKNNVSLSSEIESTIFETNSFLMDNNPTLIEYAAFFGSFQIFKYLSSNGIELTSSLWLYAIHSNNLNIINFLEENKVQPEEGSYISCLEEAIKCHHNDIANYIKNKFNIKINLKLALKYNNYLIIPYESYVDAYVLHYFTEIHKGIGNKIHKWNGDSKKEESINLDFDGRQKLINLIRNGNQSNINKIKIFLIFEDHEFIFYLHNKSHSSKNFLFTITPYNYLFKSYIKQDGILNILLNDQNNIDSNDINNFAKIVLRILKNSSFVENEFENTKIEVINTAAEISSMILTTERLRSEKSLLISYIEFYKLKNNKKESKKNLGKMFARENSLLVFPESSGSTKIQAKKPIYFYEKFIEMLYSSPYIDKFNRLPNYLKEKLAKEFYIGKFERLKAISNNQTLNYRSTFKIKVDIFLKITEFCDMQDNLLELFKGEKNCSEFFNNFSDKLNDLNNHDNYDDLILFLHLLSKIYENQRRDNIKFIEKIIFILKDAIKNIPNCQIFNIFKNDKQILLLLIESKLLKIDSFVLSEIKRNNYSLFFYYEIKEFLTKEEGELFSKGISKLEKDDFIKLCHEGENDSAICKIIRNDSINDFIVYLDKENLSNSSEIKNSIFETNSFLLTNSKITLIDYAAFFGSFKIFKYLYENNAIISPSIWLYAIHGQNTEIKNILEENSILYDWNKCFNESIKCHCNDLAKYILEKYIENEDKQILYPLSYILKSYNLKFIDCNFKENTFFNFFKYDYIFTVKLLMKSKHFGNNNSGNNRAIFLGTINEI